MLRPRVSRITSPDLLRPPPGTVKALLLKALDLLGVSFPKEKK
jgi:hypothetical protein